MKKTNEAIYQASLLDLFQTITKISYQSDIAFDLISEYAEKNSENVDNKNKIFNTYMEGIIDLDQLTHQLIRDGNGKDSILMVSGNSDLCCYLGKKCNHHVFEITELIYDIIGDKLPVYKGQQQDYMLTDLSTLHQETTNIDQELGEIIDKLSSEEEWIERNDQIDGWHLEREVYGKVKNIVDHLINDNNKNYPVLLIKVKCGESYYLGGCAEIHVIQVSHCIYDSIVNDIKKHDIEVI